MAISRYFEETSIENVLADIDHNTAEKPYIGNDGKYHCPYCAAVIATGTTRCECGQRIVWEQNNEDA